MNRTRALIVSLAVGLAAIAGVFALGHTLALSDAGAARPTDQQVAQRTAQLDRYEASLRKDARAEAARAAGGTRTGSTGSALQVAAAARPAASARRVVYHRPPPVVVIKHRAGGEEEPSTSEHEGVEADD